MASDLCIIPTLHDIEKSVLDLSSQVRLQSAFLRDLIERVGEEEEADRGMDEVNGKIVLNENEAEKILERTSDLKEELEKFKLNLKNYQDFMKQSRNGVYFVGGHESRGNTDEPNDTFEDENKDKSKIDNDTIVAQPESHSEDIALRCSFHITSTSEDCSDYQEHEENCVTHDGMCSPLSSLSLTHKHKEG
uniref:Uncharacterized protein LOC111121339 isoform X1 n=1 Tax=Crassostrea virginica TaxID=6565 RepID=A0A8B8CSV3_CRAVI|nr:uncharacterized protein LOC111121339 isoform X1 [Crassostrea virginica]